jgi:hypothetical protein
MAGHRDGDHHPLQQVTREVMRVVIGATLCSGDAPIDQCRDGALACLPMGHALYAREWFRQSAPR